MSEAPPCACYVCHARHYWQHAITGRWICATCHPAPVPSLVRTKHEALEPAGPWFKLREMTQIGKAGISIKQLASELGFSRQWLERVCRQRGVFFGGRRTAEVVEITPIAPELDERE